MENPEKLYFDDLSGEDFENYLKSLFENLNYRVELTPKSGDYGADLIITKDNIKTAVQAKRYSDLVGISAIQEVIGAISYYNAHSGIVVTNNYFTPNAIELARSADIELWDRDILIKNIIKSLGSNDNFMQKDLPKKKLDNNTTKLYTNQFINNELFLGISYQYPLIVGYDSDSKLIVEDINNIHHLLISGTINSGKSTFLYCILISLMRNPNNNNIRFVIIDTKGLEFYNCDGISFLMIPIIIDSKKALSVFHWLIAEMSNRYKIFSEYHKKDIELYNEYAKKNGLKSFERIVFLIDEISEMYEINKQEIIKYISDITLKGSQVGIHLFVATRDPFIEKSLERYFPSQAYMSNIEDEYHTVLKIPYRNDLNLRISFIPTNDIDNMISVIKTDDINYIEEQERSLGIFQSDNNGKIELDEYFVNAGRFVIDKDMASIGALQRIFKVSFNRAAKIMDQLCSCGIIGKEEGIKPREILMSLYEFEKYIKENNI